MTNSNIQTLDDGKHHLKTTTELLEDRSPKLTKPARNGKQTHQARASQGALRTNGQKSATTTGNERQRKTVKEQTAANQQNDIHQNLTSKLSLSPNRP